MRELVISKYEAGQRFDKFLAKYMELAPKSFFYKMMRKKNITLNGKKAAGNEKLEEGDTVKLFLSEETIEGFREKKKRAVHTGAKLDILYEDTDVIVVNKPKGMVVHPASGHYSGTLVNALLYHCKDLSGINGVMRPGIVHRIDKDTTGSLIACKNDFAHNSIAEQLKEHSIVRKYRAICFGSLKEEEGTVDKPIGRDPNNRKKMAVVPNGKHAVTHYRVLEHFNGYTYIECILETGRTHQIRVHMASIGHPLLGDEVYSNRKAPFHLEGQTLHAMTLGFKHPHTGEYIETNAPLPDYFVHLLQILHQ